MERRQGLERGHSSRLNDDGEHRQFGLVVGGAFVVLSVFLIWRGHVTAAAIALPLGGLLITFGAVAPTRLASVHRAWMGMAHAISKVTTPVFLGLVYFLVLTPTGLLVRLFDHRPLEREADDSGYWVKRERGRDRSEMLRQF